MSEIIAELPVRANRAATRHKAGAPSAPAQPARVTREDTEATLLVREVAGIIQVYLIPLTSCWPWAISSIAGADHIVEADNQLCDLAKTEEAFAACGEPPRPAMSDHIPQIAASLRKAVQELGRPLGDLGQQLTALVLVENASNLLERLQAAHAGLPGTMDDLRELATFAGVRTHREQPRPPIRREPTANGIGLHADPVDADVACRAIANQAGVLSTFLCMARHSAEDNKDVCAANDFLMAQYLVESMGSIADEVLGGNVAGGPIAWAKAGGA